MAIALFNVSKSGTAPKQILHVTRSSFTQTLRLLKGRLFLYFSYICNLEIYNLTQHIHKNNTTGSIIGMATLMLFNESRNNANATGYTKTFTSSFRRKHLNSQKNHTAVESNMKVDWQYYRLKKYKKKIFIYNDSTNDILINILIG